MTGCSGQTRACSYAAWPSLIQVSTTVRLSSTASSSLCCASASRSSRPRNWVTSFLGYPLQAAGSATPPSTGCGTGISSLSWTIQTSAVWRSSAIVFGRKSASPREWRRQTSTVKANRTALSAPTLLCSLKLPIPRSSQPPHHKVGHGSRLELLRGKG